MTMPNVPDGLANITLSAVLAQAQALDLAMRDATTGECRFCECNVCQTMRGMAQRIGMTDG